MVIQSPYSQIDIPETNILTYLFGDGENVPKKPLWVDAVDDKKTLSAATGLQLIKRIALGLGNADVPAGEVILIVSPNHIFVPVVYLGIVGSGRIFSGANPACTADELCYQIKDTGTRTVLVHPTLLPTAQKAAAKAELPDSSLYLFSDSPQAPNDGIRDWHSILASSEDAATYQWPEFNGLASKAKIAAINYSSGTTGLPKGVMISHYNLVSNVEQSRYTRYVNQPDSNAEDERWIGLLPLYHAFGQMYTIMVCLKQEIVVYLMQGFDFELFLKVIQDRKITTLQIAPPIVVLLNKHPSVAKYDLSSVVTILCGAAPLAGALQNSVSARLDTPISQGWGMTEVTCTGLSVPGGKYDNTGSVGTLQPNCEIKLVNDDGKEVALGERGEIYFRGPNVSLGYWKNEKATRETMLDEGWLRTGDLAVADGRGWFWIVDRLKELIKVSGFQVAPAELEAILLSHDSIADAAVTSVSSTFSDQELVRAYIMLKPEAGGKINERDIITWIEEKVAKYKRLTGGVKFVDQVPKTASGKIMRKVLREWAKKDAEVRAKL